MIFSTLKVKNIVVHRFVMHARDLVDVVFGVTAKETRRSYRIISYQFVSDGMSLSFTLLAICYVREARRHCALLYFFAKAVLGEILIKSV
jgi:hypothetical protein